MFFIDKEAVFSWVEAALSWARSYVLMGSKLCSHGLETMFAWARNYVPNVVML